MLSFRMSSCFFPHVVLPQLLTKDLKACLKLASAFRRKCACHARHDDQLGQAFFERNHPISEYVLAGWLVFSRQSTGLDSA